MSAIAIRPVTVDDTVLTDTDAVESVAAWSSGTTYNTGDYARSDTTHRVYQSAIDSNLAQDPTDAANRPDKWIDVRPTNPFAMFDELKSTRTTRADSLTWTMEPGQSVNSLGLARLTGASVQVVVNDGSSDVYDETYELNSVDGITDWYSWFTEERVQEDTLILTDLPTVETPAITVTLAGSGSTVAVGACALGRSLDLGSAELGATLDYKDYSTYEEDGFGGVIVYQRGYSFNEEVRLLIANTRLKHVRSELLRYRGTPIFWKLSTELTVLQAFGFMKRFTPVIEYNTHSLASLRVEETLETS